MPLVNEAVHVVGQLIPAGELVTVPEPASVGAVTVNWYDGVGVGGGVDVVEEFEPDPHPARSRVDRTAKPEQQDVKCDFMAHFSPQKTA